MYECITKNEINFAIDVLIKNEEVKIRIIKEFESKNISKSIKTLFFKMIEKEPKERPTIKVNPI
jgi:hypothetical protein